MSQQAVVSGYDTSLRPTPSMYASDSPFTAELIWAILLLDQFAILCICGLRLWQYHKLGVLRLGCIKSLFHGLLMLTVPLMCPLQILCLSYTKRMPDCNASKHDSLYMLNWELYALSRLAAPLMVMCLSLVTVLWSDFIGVDEVRAVSFGNLFPSRISLHGAPRRIRSGDCLRIGLAATNCFALLVSLLFEVAVLFEPSVIWYGTKGDPNSNSWPIQLGWLCYESTRFALVVLMIYYGYQVQQRIGATGVFTSPEDEKKAKERDLASFALTGHHKCICGHWNRHSGDYLLTFVLGRR
mmetsp:Transcript_15873/g.41737  ORF Transcript_15873/g.41737 Transcript_15873/m.41737 type:complete len:297 (-) Transcript_15873:405-1295(-)